MIKRIITFSLMATSVCLANEMDTTAIDANTIGANISSTYSNNLSSKVFAPMTTDSNISTLDGSKSGSGTLTCVANNFTLGNILFNNGSLSVTLDTNGDGSNDYSNNYSSIKGVSSNGLMFCSSGFTGCRYYTWNYNATSKLHLIERDQKEVGGMYALSGVYSRDEVANDIAGGIMSVLQSSLNYVITPSNVTNGSISYLAQSLNNCSNTGVSYSSNSGIPSDSTLASQAATAQTTGNESYSVLTSISSNESTNSVPQSDINAITAESGSITNSVNVASGQPLTYSSSTGNGSVNIYANTTPETVGCMVQWEETYTPVTTDGQTRGVTATGVTKTIKEEIRVCGGEYNNICPVTTGETIKYDCGNLSSSLAESAGAFETVNEMSDDMICSH